MDNEKAMDVLAYGLDIAGILQIIKSNRQTYKKVMTEESKLAKVVREAYGIG